MIDAGNYPLLAPIVVSSTPGIGDDSGFIFTGPANLTRPATFSFANPLTVAPLLTLNDASFMTLSDLTFAGGQYGVLVENSSNNLNAGYLTLTNNTVDGLLVENSLDLTLEHDTATDNAEDGIVIQSGSTVSDLGYLTVTGNGGDGLYVNGIVTTLHNSSFTYNDGNGITFDTSGSATIQDNVMANNGGDGIFVDVTGTGLVTIGNANLTQNLGNIVSDNGASGIYTSGDVLVAGNVISGSQSSTGAGVYLNFSGEISDNDIFDNYAGIITVDSNSTVDYNRVYDNVGTGISVSQSSPVYDNVIYSNSVGLYLNSSYMGEINNNLIYANTTQGILDEAGSSAGTQIVNNTIYEPQGDGIDALDDAENLRLLDNIVWVQSGYDISVAANSEVGFSSDYNILYTSGTGQVGLWQGIARPTLTSWRDADFTDADSLALNPLFVNVVNSSLGYVSPTQDGRSDDFHEQSQQGSYHGGALAPVVSAATGLPVFPTPTLTVDPNESPAIDLGDPSESFANEPTPNGGYINIGAYGNTSQASLSPQQYLVVTSPGTGGEVWPEGQTFTITWRFTLAPVNGSTPPAGTVDINLLQVGSSTPVLNVASAVPNSGQFSWTLSTSITPGSNYLIQVTSDQVAGLSGVSAKPFSITSAVHVYYVNNGTVIPGDFSTAPGNDSNSGLSPAAPKATIAGVLAAYHLNAGDTILLDAGTYTVSNTIVLAAAESGIIIEGYNNPAFPNLATVLNRGNTANDVIDVNGATNVTLEDLTVTGGSIGISALDSSASTGLTVTNCIVYGNNTTGIYIGVGDNNAQITNNTVYGVFPSGGIATDQSNGIDLTGNNDAVVSGNTVYSSRNAGVLANNPVVGADISGNILYLDGTGVYINNDLTGLANLATVSDNTVFSNTTGIYDGGDILVTGNVIYGQSGDGIDIPNYVYEVVANIIHDNGEGIYSHSNSSAPIVDNTVYHNSGYGIEAQGGTTVTGNTTYGNYVGIAVDDSVSGTTALVQNNVVYANTSEGILIENSESGSYVNNTVYQPTGDAIDVLNNDTNVSLSNNILWTQNGFDIKVDATSEVGFQSDYNDLYTTSAGVIGSWGGQTLTTLASWILDLSLDRHSLSVNPQFVNASGSNGIVGYSTAPIGSPQIINSGSGSGFSIVGNWTRTTSTSAQGGSFLTTPAGTGSSTATWTFTGLVPGAIYQVETFWVPLYYLTGDAPFTIYDGANLISQGYYSQTPTGNLSSPGWVTLGYEVSNSGTLTIELSNASLGTVEADAVEIQQIQGIGNDNYHLAAGSPAIDAGNPASSVSEEPQPNGGRINLGSDGGTAAATTSAPEALQVLSPTALSKFQVGQQVNIIWLTNGLSAPSTGTVSIYLVQNGQQVQTIATDVPDTDSYSWSIPSGQALGSGYQIEVTANQGSMPSGLSSQTFLITNNGNNYYIAANGSDANSGKDAADPMISLNALFAAYTIGSGATVTIAAGNYTLLETVVLGVANSGLTIVGPASGRPRSSTARTAASMGSTSAAPPM